MSSDDELPDIPYCPLPAKKTRSDGEEAFLELQTRLHELLSIPAKNRSDDERKEYERLRKKYAKDKKAYPHLVEERAAATGAQRLAAFRNRQTGEERVQEQDDICAPGWQRPKEKEGEIPTAILLEPPI